MTIRAVALAAILVVALAAGGVPRIPAAEPPSDPGEGPPIPTPEERAAALKYERLRAGERATRPEAEAGAAGPLEGAGVGVDALHYTLDLDFNSSSQTVSGTVTGRYEVLAAGLTTLVLDLYDNMSVSRVLLDGTRLSFAHGGNLLTITLDRPYAAGEVIDVAVTYSGTPQNISYGSFVWSTHGSKPLFWSLSQPTYGPTWWPSVDDPADKATADMLFTVRDDLIAVSNGLLVDTTPLPANRTRFHWQTTYPIATYLISIACTDYVTFTQFYTPQAGGDPMEIGYWTYPDLLGATQGTFGSVPSIIDRLAGWFGEYPFIDEKYGIAICDFSGGMEHQTATSYGSSWVTGDEDFIWLTVHELAHEWWGNAVTLQDWRETWLNEGFATYTEALYYEDRWGDYQYHRYMDLVLYVGVLCPDPLYDHPEPFGRCIYNKGAWILHMLRHVLRDADFFQTLEDYYAQRKYGNVTTDDLRADVEAVWGQDLEWFFDQWIFAGGRPIYKWGWSVADTGSGYVLHVHIEQAQSYQKFRMPLDIVIESTEPVPVVTVWNDADNTEFAIPLFELPTAVYLDPDNWVLKYATEITLPDADTDGVPDSADNCGATPNPAQENYDGDALGDACDPDADNDGVLNASDCAPLDEGSFALPAEAAALLIDAAALSWDSLAGQAGPGTLYDVIRGAAGNLVPAGGVAGAACFAPGEGGLSVSHGVDPDAGGIDYFLVRGRNACGAGTYGDASSGAERINAACP